MNSALHLLSAVQLRDAFLKNQVSAIEIASHFLDRMERHNPTLGAFLTILKERAMQSAERLDYKLAQDLPLGKLAAVPIAIKDNMHIRHEITTCGSHFLRNYRAPFTATAVQLLEQEDALLMGKTNLDEFSMGSSNENSAFFPVKNPWDLNLVPGGSSGGSAAAVASRLTLLATGSDTGGSIRQPASFCGITGFKPSYGRVSRYGLVAFGSSFDQIGPLGSTVTDVALAMEVMGRHCSHDSTSLNLPSEVYVEKLSTDLKGLRFGVPWHFLEGLKPEPRENFMSSLDLMRQQGAEIVEIDLDICKYAIAIYYILSTAEASTNLARFDGIRYGVRSPNAKSIDDIYELSRAEGFGKEVQRRILLGSFVLSSGYKEAFYQKAQKVRTLLTEAFEDAFSCCDAILVPTAPTTAFQLNAIADPVEMYLQDIFTVPASLCGLPALSVPSGFDSKGLPFGLQMIGPLLHDSLVMQYGYAFEQAALKYRKTPPHFEEAL